MRELAASPEPERPPPAWSSARARAGLGAAGGLVMSLGAAPLDLWPCALLGLALFALALEGARPRAALLAGWSCGAFATLGAARWVVETVTRYTDLPTAAAWLAFVLVGAIAGVTLGLAGLGYALARRVLTGPGAAFLAVLAAERYVPGIFPWQLGVPYGTAPALPQSADLLGVSGLGAWLFAALLPLAALARARLSSTPRAGSRRGVLLALGALALPWCYGALRGAQVDRVYASAPTLRAALVQPSIEPQQRWQPEHFERIYRQLHAQTDEALVAVPTPELVVWSETAYPYPLPHRAQRDGEAGPLVYPRATPAPIVVGALTDPGGEGGWYNSALLRETDGTLSAPVAKRILVPFGEYVPVLGEWRWFRERFARASGLRAGVDRTMLTTRRGLRLGVLNCFEDTFARAAADVHDADLLVNVTNDAWFGRGGEAWQHLMLARWRAIETRRDLLRAVNTGVTCHVDALGRVRAQLPTWQQGVLHTTPRRLALRPLAPHFVRVGPPVALALVALAAVAELVAKRRARR